METRRIIVVDDDPVIREVLDINLRNAGMETYLVSNGEDALDHLRSQRFDLIILDIMMPGIDGYELLKMIRDDPSLEQMNVVLLTARNSDKDRMIGTGIFKADGYLTKPFDIQHVVKTIKEFF